MNNKKQIIKVIVLCSSFFSLYSSEQSILVSSTTHASSYSASSSVIYSHVQEGNTPSIPLVTMTQDSSEEEYINYRCMRCHRITVQAGAAGCIACGNVLYTMPFCAAICCPHSFLLTVPGVIVPVAVGGAVELAGWLTYISTAHQNNN